MSLNNENNFGAKNNIGIVGATGEVGREVVRHLCLLKLNRPESFNEIHTYGRNDLSIDDCFHRELKSEDQSNYESLKKIFQDIVKTNKIDFEELIKNRHDKNITKNDTNKMTDFDTDNLLPDHNIMKNCSIGFCCLGTTHGKAGSNAGFRRVDLDYIVESARCAYESGVKKYFQVSSGGSNSKSRFNYFKTKGEADYKVAEMGFDICGIFKPGTLLCDRREYRTFERPLHFVSKLDLWNWTSIQTSDVAAGMVYMSQAPREEIEQMKFNNKELMSANQKHPNTLIRDVMMAENVKMAAKFYKLIGRSLSKRLSRCLLGEQEKPTTVMSQTPDVSELATAPGSVANI